MALTAGLAVFAAGCGDDDDDDDDDHMHADASPDTPDAPPGSTCPDHPDVTDMGTVCAVSGPDTAPITQDLTLTADNDYLLDGPVFIGNDTDETVLTIEAGVTIFGGDGSFLLIQRGSKIMAEGTASAPIVMTSAKADGSRGPEDWGGLVINGKAPINNGDANGEAPGEAGTGTYGGNTSADDSGVLKYVSVQFAGNKVDAENELNGIAFQGVGSGTEVDFIQTHMTSDDGIEFFGGTVNVKHVVVTGSDDDSVDWTGGWSGKAQFIVANQLPSSGVDAERGIEADNLEADHAATPNSNPTFANMTIVARAKNGAQGVELRRGTMGHYHNFIVSGFGGPCLRISNADTATHVTNEDLTVDNWVMDCGGGTIVDGTDAAGSAAKLLADGNIVEDDPDLDANWQPQAGSPALGIGSGPTGDSFFDNTDYAGAFDGTNDWTDGWIETAEN